jgi:hypothetical protein
MLGDTKHESDTLPRGLAFFFIPSLDYFLFFFFLLEIGRVVIVHYIKRAVKVGSEKWCRKHPFLLKKKKNRKEKNYYRVETVGKIAIISIFP